MRLAVVSTSYPRNPDDPAGHFVAAEVRALRGEGHEVEVFAPTCPPFGWPGLSANLRQAPWHGASAARQLLALRGKLDERAAACPFDGAVAHWSVLSAPVVWAARAPRLELVSHGADVRLLVALPVGVRCAVVRRLAERATSWRFVSDTLRDQLLRALSHGGTRAAVSRLAHVQAPALEVATTRARAPADLARTALCVGRLVPSKRFEQAIAYASARADIARLVIVGDGPERARLETTARAHAHASRLETRFTGLLPRSEALRWIAAADVLLHASHTEGLSTVVREAEALGTPVVRC